MAQPNPTIGEVASVTIANYSKDAADNVSQHNALLYKIDKSGNYFDGGTQLQEIIEFAPNVNVNSYSGGDTLGTASQDVLTTAVFPLKQYSGQVLFTGTDELQNAGKERMVPLVASRVKNVFHSLENRLNQDLYTDGTGNGGKNITGLLAAVPFSPTNTYGGINRATTTNAFWLNVAFGATANGSGPATVANGLMIPYWNLIVPQVTRQKDKPTLIISSIANYAIFEAGLQNIQRIMNADMGSAGFEALEYHGIPVMFDSVASGIGSNTTYFLNTDYLEFRVHKDRNMVELEDKSSVNQDATVKTIVWAGNLVSRGSFLQANFQNT
jgi:hypothetical protein